METQTQFNGQPQQYKRMAIFAINEREGMDRAFWTKIGAGFRNRDGSYNIHLDALPTNGKLHMREVEPRPPHDRRGFGGGVNNSQGAGAELVRQEGV